MRKYLLSICSILIIDAIVLCAQPLSIGGYNVYYGILHNHSNCSDGKGTVEDAYKYAKNNARLDFFSLADHSDYTNYATSWSLTKSIADSFNQDGVYTTFWGFEWSHPDYGHVAVINTNDYKTCMNKNFDTLYVWLN